MLEQEILLTIFKFKNFLFGGASVVKNGDKEKYVYNNGYEITFDSAGLWSFNNDTARNVIIFADNRKNNFFVLDEGPTFRTNGSFGSPESLVLILVKQAQNFA